MDSSGFQNAAVRLSRNPLGIIALFIALIYSFACLVLGLTSGLSPANKTVFVWFLVSFPVIVFLGFFYLVIKHPGKLYAPGDYQTDAAFHTATSPRILPLSDAAALARFDEEAAIGLIEIKQHDAHALEEAAVLSSGTALAIADDVEEEAPVLAGYVRNRIAYIDRYRHIEHRILGSLKRVSGENRVTGPATVIAGVSDTQWDAVIETDGRLSAVVEIKLAGNGEVETVVRMLSQISKQFRKYKGKSQIPTKCIALMVVPSGGPNAASRRIGQVINDLMSSSPDFSAWVLSEKEVDDSSALDNLIRGIVRWVE